LLESSVELESTKLASKGAFDGVAWAQAGRRIRRERNSFILEGV